MDTSHQHPRLGTISNTLNNSNLLKCTRNTRRDRFHNSHTLYKVNKAHPLPSIKLPPSRRPTLPTHPIIPAKTVRPDNLSMLSIKMPLDPVSIVSHPAHPATHPMNLIDKPLNQVRRVWAQPTSRQLGTLIIDNKPNRVMLLLNKGKGSILSSMESRHTLLKRDSISNKVRDLVVMVMALRLDRDRVRWTVSRSRWAG